MTRSPGRDRDAQVYRAAWLDGSRRRAAGGRPRLAPVASSTTRGRTSSPVSRSTRMTGLPSSDPHPVRSPAPHRRQHGPELPALVGEAGSRSGGLLLVADLDQHPLVDQPVEPLGQDGPAEPSEPWRSSKRDRPLKSSRITIGVHQSPTRSVIRAIGHGQSSKRVRRTYDPATGASTRSMRAGTCLCHGVPASQSRSSTTSARSAPRRSRPVAVLSGVVEAQAVGQGHVTRLHRCR